MRAEHIDAFLSSAVKSLARQSEARPERGSPILRSGKTHSTRELTALVELHGDLTGMIFYSMSLATANKLVGDAGTVDPAEEKVFNSAALVEVTRAMSAEGVTALASSGCRCTADEPLVVHGFGEPLSDASPVLVVPLFTEYGDIDLGIALQVADTAARPTHQADAAGYSETGEMAAAT